MNLAPTTTPVHELIRQRWSPRAFTEQSIPEASVQQLFEAASWAASAMNAQPWRYVYAHRADTAAFEKLLSCLVPANQAWARHAAVLVLTMAKTTLADGKPNGAALHDLGAANATLVLEATALGLHGHFMGGFDRARARELYQLPADLEPVAMLALGYAGPAEQLDEPLRSRELAPRQRQPVAQFAFRNELQQGE